MALTNLERVRLKVSDKSAITREQATSDGISNTYKLGHGNVAASPALQVRVNDSLLTVDVDYTLDASNGIVTFTVVPAVNATIEFTYYWSIFSDAEVQDFLEESGDNTTIAAARLLLAWAADAARLSKRQTLSGGGGLGQAVIDTSVAAKELRATAQALIDMEAKLGESVPSDGLTEVPWTEMHYRRQLEQHIIREN